MFIQGVGGTHEELGLTATGWKLRGLSRSIKAEDWAEPGRKSSSLSRSTFTEDGADPNPETGIVVAGLNSRGLFRSTVMDAGGGGGGMVFTAVLDNGGTAGD